MRLFHTALFSTDSPGHEFKSAGIAWVFEKESGVQIGTAREILARSEKIKRERGRAPSVIHDASEEMLPYFDMEIRIRAKNSATATKALNLLISGAAVLDGDLAAVPEPFNTVPYEVGTQPTNKNFMSREGLLEACILANRASRSRSAAYAIHKLALSY